MTLFLPLQAGNWAQTPLPAGVPVMDATTSASWSSSLVSMSTAAASGFEQPQYAMSLYVARYAGGSTCDVFTSMDDYAANRVPWLSGVPFGRPSQAAPATWDSGQRRQIWEGIDGKGWPTHPQIIGADPGERHLGMVCPDWPVIGGEKCGVYFDTMFYAPPAAPGGAFGGLNALWGYAYDLRHHDGVFGNSLSHPSRNGTRNAGDRRGSTASGHVMGAVIIQNQEWLNARARWDAGDFANALIPHVIAYEAYQHHPNRWQWPANRTDDAPPYGSGGNPTRLGHAPASPVEMGGWFRINPSFNVRTLADRDKEILARTLQVYGAVLTDQTGGGIKFLMQHPRGFTGVNLGGSYPVNVGEPWVRSLLSQMRNEGRIQWVNAGKPYENFGEPVPSTVYRSVAGSSPTPTPDPIPDPTPAPTPTSAFSDDFADGVVDTAKWPDNSAPFTESGGAAQLVPGPTYPTWSSVKGLTLEGATPGQVTFTVKTWPAVGALGTVEVRFRLLKSGESRAYEFRRVGATMYAANLVFAQSDNATALTGWSAAETRLRVRKTIDGFLIFETATPAGSFTVRQTITPPSAMDGLNIQMQAFAPTGEAAPGVLEVESVLLEPASATPTDITAPAAPVGLTRGDLSAGTVPLSWASNTEPDLASYQVERSEGGTFTPIAPTRTTNSYTDTAVTRGSTYSYRVRARDTAGNLSAPSATLTVQVPLLVDTTAPAVPATPTASARNRGAVLTISPVNTEADFAFYRWEVDPGGTGYQEVGTSIAGSFTATNLANGVAHTFRARAVDAAGNVSGPSGTVIVTPVAAAMTTLDNVELLPGDGRMRVLWDPPPAEEDVDEVHLYVAPVGSAYPSSPTWTGQGSILGGRRFADINGLTNDVDYKFSIRPARD